MTFELTRDEVGSTEEPEMRIGQRVLDLFASLGLPEPQPVPLLPVTHQVAQKLHACTLVDAAGGNERAHDLIDLQILVREEEPRLAEVRSVATRLFASRRRQAWPPVVIAFRKWESIYAEQSQGLDVLASMDEAVDWANGLILEIDAAGD